MPGSAGFWSYVQLDDKAEGGRISRLAQDVRDQFEMQTGESIDLFLDKDHIRWGEDWRSRIDESLASVAFFIAVLTPRYFTSAECRHELHLFASKATELGMKELVLPLHYVDVPALDTELPQDDLVALVKTFQWDDWRDLRFCEVSSERYRRAVDKLVARLVSANERAEKATLVPPTMVPGTTDADQQPGLLDQLAETEQAIPLMSKTIESIGEEVQQVGSAVEEATKEMRLVDSRGGGFGGRLLVVRKLANQLSGRAESIQLLGNEFTSHLHSIDEGVRAIISRASLEIGQDPENKEAVCSFFGSLHSFNTAVQGGLESTAGMIESFAPIEKMSRDLRPVLKRLKQGLTALFEAQTVSDEWIRLIDASGIDCVIDE